MTRAAATSANNGSTLSGSAWIKLAVFFIFLIAVGWGVLGLAPDKITPERVRAYVLSFGLWAPAMYFLVYGQPIVPLPASIMMATAGLAFGPLWGTILALGSATTRACGQLMIARVLGREAVTKLLHGRVATLNRKVGEHGFKAVFLIRVIPNVPLDMQNFAIGFSQVRFLPYLFGTLLGLIPHAFAYVYLGYSLTDPQQVWKFVVAILMIAAFVVWQQRLARRSRDSG